MGNKLDEPFDADYVVEHTPKLIATILKALREQLKENDHLNAVDEIAGPVPDDQILKDGEKF